MVVALQVQMQKCALHHVMAGALCFIIEASADFLVTEEHNMGTSLYNKIPLGRSSVLSSTPVRAALLLAVCLSIALSWMAIGAIQ
jgi:hypothetical protein